MLYNEFESNFLSAIQTSFIPTTMHPVSVALALLGLPPAFASITCLTVGQSATARWKNAVGNNCTWTGHVGSNFGPDVANGGEYGLCNRLY